MSNVFSSKWFSYKSLFSKKHRQKKISFFISQDVSACRFDGHCEVTKSTRRYCAACRLAKCLTVGMSPDFIRKEELTGTKRKSSTSHSQELIECQSLMVRTS
jgi:hypothetical protein